MTTWNDMIYYALPTVLLAACGAWMAFKEKRNGALALSILALILFGTYIGLMWHSLERPPMRTMGETRLWYSFFALLAGVIVYLRWHYKWILGFSTILASVFIVINLVRPEIHNKSMMPALESPFFVPHVISYMFSYGMLGAGLLVALYALWIEKKKGEEDHALRLMSV